MRARASSPMSSRAWYSGRFRANSDRFRRMMAVAAHCQRWRVCSLVGKGLFEAMMGSLSNVTLFPGAALDGEGGAERFPSAIKAPASSAASLSASWAALISLIFRSSSNTIAACSRHHIASALSFSLEYKSMSMVLSMPMRNITISTMNAVMSTSENPAVTQSRSSMAQALDMSGSMAAAWNTLTMHPRMPFGLTDPGRRNWEVPKAVQPMKRIV
mmetsp:Transcript_27351/g.61164  ORF Transcript_27351/g.61164 Transcript_27351/m.61164 type:complete len:215 (-) Transcript_27351:343-987(-)